MQSKSIIIYICHYYDRGMGHTCPSPLLRYDNIPGMPATLELSLNSVVFRASKLPLMQRLTTRKVNKDFEFQAKIILKSLRSK